MNPEIPEGQTQFQKMKDQYSALLADSTEIPAKENTTSPKTDDDSLFSEEDLKTVFGQNYPCKKLAPLKQNILIVEDDFYVRTLLKDILESEFEILMADDGESGLTMANKFDLDLILLDLIMPRMDGRGTLKRLRCNRKTSDVPIIIVSGAPSFGTSMEILASGANDFLQKPFSARELTARVRAVLKRRKKETSLSAQLEDVKVKGTPTVLLYETDLYRRNKIKERLLNQDFLVFECDTLSQFRKNLSRRHKMFDGVIFHSTQLDSETKDSVRNACKIFSLFYIPAEEYLGAPIVFEQSLKQAL